jgi:hypothetical protein
LLPVTLGVGVRAQDRGKLSVGVKILPLQPALKGGPQRVDRPVDDGVSRVFDQLPDDLPADAGVGPSLHLDQGGDSVLVEEQVIDRPAPAAIFGVGHCGLAVDQNPASCLTTRNLIASEEIRKLGNQALQHVLAVIGRLGHRHQVVLTP